MAGRNMVQVGVNQPLDSDLTAIAALTTTTFGRSLLDDADAAAAQATLALPPPHPGYVAGKWYQPGGSQIAASSVPGTGNIFSVPFLVPAAVTITQLGARVTTAAASGVFKVGIYASNATTKFPTGAVLAETGDMSTTSTGVVEANLVGANATLAPGWYWSAVQVDATGATAAFQTWIGSANPAAWLVGSATHATISGSATLQAITFFTAQAYGAFPNMTAVTPTESASNASCLLHFKTI
jgi:hypothetical protein